MTHHEHQNAPPIHMSQCTNTNSSQSSPKLQYKKVDWKSSGLDVSYLQITLRAVRSVDLVHYTDSSDNYVSAHYLPSSTHGGTFTTSLIDISLDTRSTPSAK